MKFYFCGKDGTRRELTDEELHQRLSIWQIKEAIEAKRDDPNEEVSYMTAGGFIVVENE